MHGHPFFLCFLEGSLSYRKQYLINHLLYHHLPKSGRLKRQIFDENGLQQLSIKRMKAFTAKSKERIKQAHLDFLGESGLPLRTCETEEWTKLMKVIWEESTSYFADYQSIPLSSREFFYDFEIKVLTCERVFLILILYCAGWLNIFLL